MLHNSFYIKEQSVNGCSKLFAKVSDFGLSKSFSGTTAYERIQRPNVPWKWIAPEALYTHRKYTLVSDVWSFGIVLWEMFSLGKEPYDGLNQQKDLVEKLLVGYKLPCPDQLKKVKLTQALIFRN